VHFSLHPTLSTLSTLSLFSFSLTSAPRRSDDSLPSRVTLLYFCASGPSRSSRFVRPTQQSGVTFHYSVGSQGRCYLPGDADAIYIHYFLLLSPVFNCHQVGQIIECMMENVEMKKKNTGLKSGWTEYYVGPG
jgi:hypothetical protein